LKVTHCDLFFADAAVLIEGPAERILVPHFVRYQDEFRELSECYITWLEITGSHAHRLRELIEHLALNTLIITDLDATDPEGRAVVPARAVGQLSRNETLKSWCPAVASIDELFAKSPVEKIKEYPDLKFAVRAAYQSPVNVQFKSHTEEALANTLEDSLLFQNVLLFTNLEGKGLIRKFRNAITESGTIAELSTAVSKALKDGGKAELALDLLEIEDAGSLKPPEYIREGLLWLLSQLRQHQEELGLPVVAERAPARVAA
jgi:hypothetical protein